MSAMRAERLGSYSIAVTRPGTPTLSRRKSIMRSLRFAPPPRWRVVMRPWLLRPPCFRNGATSDFSGSFRVISSKPGPVAPRRPGEVGLKFLIGILNALEQLQLVLRVQRHHRLLPGARVLHPVAPNSLRLSLHVDDVYPGYLDVERCLHRLLDLDLVGVDAHFKGVLVFAVETGCLLRDHRPDHHVQCV